MPFKQRHRVLGLLFMLAVITYVDRVCISVAGTSIQEDLKTGEVAIKDWSENEGILDFLVQNKIVKEPHRFVESGYVKIPICELI